jgi:two-component system, NarL family, nitrate/nitrite response regulator NarL
VVNPHAVEPSGLQPFRHMTLRCLIVDDNPRFGDEATSLLEQEGVAVVGVASSGDEAIRLVDALAPDLVLIDISLGEESGFEVARRLAGTSRAHDPAVIFVSSHDEEDFKPQIAASPALGFIAKTKLSAERIHRLLET